VRGGGGGRSGGCLTLPFGGVGSLHTSNPLQMGHADIDAECQIAPVSSLKPHVSSRKLQAFLRQSLRFTKAAAHLFPE